MANEITRLRDLKTSARDQLMIDPRIIVIEKGHNPRDYRLPENRAHLNALKASIKENGTLVPLLVRYDAETKAAVLVDGECRLRANLELIQEDVPIATVPTIQVSGKKEDDRLFDALIANTGKPLSKWEAGNAFRRLYKFGHEADAIAKKLGYPLRYVTEAMELNDAPDEVKYLLSEQAVSPAFALSEIRKSPTGAVMVLKQAAEEAKVSGKKTATKPVKSKTITLHTLVKSFLSDFSEKELAGLDNAEEQWVSVDRKKFKKLLNALGIDYKNAKVA
jgi:ParB/RepB/Spo0J family partition protein